MSSAGSCSVLRQRDCSTVSSRRGLISPASIVEGDLAVIDTSRRNQNFAVVKEAGPSYFIKQAVRPGDEETLAHEAAVYEWLCRNDRRSDLEQFIPRFHEFDRAEQALVLELVPGAADPP